ncbi:class I SAM-dependent methyltransferase [candidate division KSB1 bacterium]|nr:class I SAM-dependent methyltransferase [candidate division KSB1 bacterium]
MAKLENARFIIKKPFRLFQFLGFHVTPNHFYEPIPDTRELSEELWTSPSELPGINLNEIEQLRLLDAFKASYKGEYDALPRDRTSDPAQYYVNNGAFASIDGEALYCFVRRFQPRRIIEIGSGNSTLLAAQAVRRNGELTAGYRCDYTVVDPFPNKAIHAGLPGLTRILADPVQRVPLAKFSELARDDILFIDSSHVLKIGSDVQFEFLELLPRLQPGVIVHVHDIFLPAEYPRYWVIDEFRFWTEQYLLQAFLSFNDAFEILFAASYLHMKHPAELAAAFASYSRERVWPGSFWMRKVR